MSISLTSLDGVLRVGNMEFENTKVKPTDLSKEWVSYGDSWTKPAPYSGSIKTFTERLAEKTETNNTYSIGGRSGFNVSSFFENSTNARKADQWYKPTGDYIDKNMTHIHLGTNDLFDKSAATGQCYITDSTYHMYLQYIAMGLICSLKNNHYLAASKDGNFDFSTYGSFASTDTTYYGNVRTNSASDGDYIVSNSNITGRYYFAWIWAEATNTTTDGHIEIQLDGSTEAHIYIPIYGTAGFNNQGSIVTYPVLIDMETSAARELKILWTKVIDTGNSGFVGVWAWDDDIDDLRPVIFDTPPMFDMIQINGGAKSVLDPTSEYDLLRRYEQRYYNTLHAVKKCVLDLRKFGFPIYLNEWNDCCNSWVDSNYLHPHNSATIINRDNIERHVIRNIENNSNVLKPLDYKQN